MRQIFFLLTLLSAFMLTVSAQTAQIMQSIDISDGDSVNLYNFYENAYTMTILPKERALAEKYYKMGIANPIMRSRGIDKIKNGLEEVTYSFEWGNVPWGYALFPDLYNIWHSLRDVIKIKPAREFIAKLIVQAITDLCNLYTKEYKQELLAECVSIRQMLIDMPNHKYALDSVVKTTWASSSIPLDGESHDPSYYEYYEYYITIDGDSERFVPYGLGASCIRRIMIDKIPREEILGYLDDAISAINGTTPKDDVLCIFKVNGRFSNVVSCARKSYFLFANGLKLIEHKISSNQWLSFYKDDSYLIKEYDHSILFNGNGKVVYDTRTEGL